MNLRRPLARLIIGLLLVVLAACGQQPATQSPTADTTGGATGAPTTAPGGASEAPTTAATGGDKVKVVWWHISTQEEHQKAWQDLANKYMQDHPNVAVEITVLENEAFKAKLTTAMQSGSPPDVFQSWGGGVLQQYAKAGLVQDLTPALQKDGWGDSFQQAPLSLFAVDGKNYGVPWNAGMVGFWYSKSLFEKAGISAPPATWDEFIDAVKKLKASGVTPIALGEGDKWPGHFYWVYLAIRLGGKDAFEKAYNRTGSFADPPFVQAGEKLKELIDLEPFQPGFLGATYPDHQAVRANGTAAMELMGHWAPGAVRPLVQDVEAFNKDLGFFPFPAVPGGAGDPSDVLGGGDGFAIGKNAPPEAIDFVRFLTNVENQTALAKAGIAVPPTVKGAEAGLEDPLLRDLLQRAGSAKYYQLYYDQYLPPAVGAVVNDATQQLFAGSATPEAVAQMIEDSAAAELKP